MNNGFKCAYFAELGKLLKKKRTLKLIISLAIIIVVFTLLFRFVYSLLEDVSGVALSEIEFADTQEELDALKAGYEEYKIASENLTKNKLIDTTIYSYKAQIAAGQFLVDNNISASSIRSFGTVSLSSNGYVLFMLDFITIVVVIYSIVAIGQLVGGELTEGVVKMELLRPIGRNELLSAKYLATLSFSTVLYLLLFVIINIAGIIFFKVDVKDVLVVLDASKAGLISPIGELVLYFIQGLIIIISLVMLTTNVSVMLKKGASVALPIVIFLIAGNIESMLGYLYVGYAGISINLEFLSALTVSGPTFNYMSLFSMLAITIVYIAINTILAHVLFNRKDIQ